MIDATLYLQAVMQRHRIISAYLRLPVDIGWQRRSQDWKSETSVQCCRQHWRERHGQDPLSHDLRYHGANGPDE